MSLQYGIDKTNGRLISLALINYEIGLVVFNYLDDSSRAEKDLKHIKLLRNTGLRDSNNNLMIESQIILYKQYAVCNGVTPSWKLKLVKFEFGKFNINNTRGAQSDFYRLGFSSTIYKELPWTKQLFEDGYYGSLDIIGKITEDGFKTLVSSKCINSPELLKLVFPDISEEVIKEELENRLVKDHWSSWAEDNSILPYEIWKKKVPPECIQLMRNDIVRELRGKLL